MGDDRPDLIVRELHAPGRHGVGAAELRAALLDDLKQEAIVHGAHRGRVAEVPERLTEHRRAGAVPLPVTP